MDDSKNQESDEENDINLGADNDIKVDTETVSPSYYSATYYKVTKVVDGDTIWVDMGGKTAKIRFIGVNTPETVSSSTPVQCYGPEASNYVKTRLTGQNVMLESDSSQGNTDYYGRLLRYVYINGENLNFLLIKYGYGFEYTFKSAYKYQELFMAAETEAKANLRGLWSPLTCNGELKSL